MMGIKEGKLCDEYMGLHATDGWLNSISETMVYCMLINWIEIKK